MTISILINNKKVYAIIVTYNGDRCIDKCLRSLHGSHLLIDIIVINNNSSDNTISIIEDNYPNDVLYKANKTGNFIFSFLWKIHPILVSGGIGFICQKNLMK
ncbi:MAG: glycosyltransferase [Bacteroidales bacterium]|nr:glycosyltransferase [Bacteroidales bacterium]